MISLNVKLRRMGNSLGIIVPSDVVAARGLHEGENLNIVIESDGKSTVGDMIREARKWNLKFKRSTQEILDEIHEGDD